MSVEIRAQVLRIMPIETVGNSNFRKRIIHVKTNDKYPQTLNLEVSGDCLDDSDKLKEGQSALFGINLRGREWTDKSNKIVVFNTLSVWKIKTDGQVSEDYKSKPPVEPEQDFISAPASSDDDDSDLPF